MTFFENHPEIPKNDAISDTLALISGVENPRLSRPNASSCHTLSVTIWLSHVCITKPIFDTRSLSFISESFLPLKRMFPHTFPTGESDGFKSLKRVVFPQPDFPQTVINSPDKTERFISLKTSFSLLGYLKFKFSILMISILTPPEFL